MKAERARHLRDPGCRKFLVQPKHIALTEAEILGVVCHERYALSGADPQSEEWKSEYEKWCSPESEIFAALEAGAANFDNLAETYSAMENAPARVGTDPRPSGK